MTSNNDLFQSFRAAFEGGKDPNPRLFLDQVEGADRLSLELLIDRYLNEEAPIRGLDEQALAAERSSQEGKAIAKLVNEPGPADLMMARRLQELEVSDVAEGLLSELELDNPTEAEKAKTVAYLDRLEDGQSPPVSNGIIEALKRVLGVDFEVFFVALSPGTSFRMATPDEAMTEEDIEITRAVISAFSTPDKEAVDRIDKLFFGAP